MGLVAARFVYADTFIIIKTNLDDSIVAEVTAIGAFEHLIYARGPRVTCVSVHC